MTVGGWIFVLGTAGSVVVVVLHLLSARAPGKRPLPTARFVPTAPMPTTKRLAAVQYPAVLVARLTAVWCAVVAVAGQVGRRPDQALARVLLVDQSRAVGSIEERADSVRALRQVATLRIVAFDTGARASTLDELAVAPLVDEPGDLSAGMVVAVREATRLRQRHERVEIVVVSPIVDEEVTSSLPTLVSVAGVDVRVARLAPKVAPQLPDAGALSAPPAVDAIGAAARNVSGLLVGRVRVRRGEPQAVDTAFAMAGGVVAWWPTQDRDSAAVVAIRTRTAVSIGAWGRPGVSSGRPVAWWSDGTPAATQHDVGDGCIRAIGLQAPWRGDAVLRPAFAAVMRDMLGPCAPVSLHPARDEVLAALVRSSDPAIDPAGTVDPPMQRLWLVLSLLALAMEWWLRRPRSRVPPAAIG